MPWQVDGTFLRVNPSFRGPTTWQQDQAATIKIIASRHDTHDQDMADGIASCLNLDGYNSMRAALNMGGFEINNLADGVTDGQAVNVAQLTIVVDAVQANQVAIAGIETSSPSSIIDGFTWDGTTLTGNRDDPDLPVEITLFSKFRSAANIRHKAVVLSFASAITIDSAVSGRHYITNNGSINLTITKPANASDPQLGATFCVEGTVVFRNDASATHSVSIVGVDPSTILGSPPTNPNLQYILSYLIIRDATGYKEQYVWSGAV